MKQNKKRTLINANKNKTNETEKFSEADVEICQIQQIVMKWKQ